MIDEAFDYIALPKEQLPGGPVQTSRGDWVFVISARLSLADVVRLIERERAGNPVPLEEVRELAAALAEQLRQ